MVPLKAVAPTPELVVNEKPPTTEPLKAIPAPEPERTVETLLSPASVTGAASVTDADAVERLALHWIEDAVTFTPLGPAAMLPLKVTGPLPGATKTSKPPAVPLAKLVTPSFATPMLLLEMTLPDAPLPEICT